MEHIQTEANYSELTEQLEALQRRLMELEEIEVMRVSEEQERFDSLQVLDEYAKQLEESRDKLARLLRAATAVQESTTVREALQVAANGVGDAGWGSVVANCFDNWEVVSAAYYGCSPSEIEFLESNRRTGEERAQLYGPRAERFKVSRSYFVPAEMIDELVDTNKVVPGRRQIQPGDTWDPMDLAYIPLYGTGGGVIGTINCDDPSDGKRPTQETIFYLELFADLAARKVEALRLLERQRITEQALRESEEKYRTVFNNSGDGFYLMDRLFRDCNSKACEIWRCNPEDIIGHSPVEFSPEYQPDGRLSSESAEEHIRGAISGSPQSFYWQHKRKDGQLIDCEVSLAPIQVGSERLVVAIVRDVTERHRSEHEREIILRILQVANSLDDRSQLVSAIVEEIKRIMPVENYFLALHDPTTNTIRFPFFVDEKDSPPPSVPLGNGLTAWIIRNGKPLLLGPGDFERMRETGEIQAQGTPALSWIGVPLTIQGRTVGALVIQSYRRESLYDGNHLRILMGVAAQVAAAIERSQSEEALEFTQFTVDQAGDAVYWIGPDARLMYVNDTACGLLGYTRDEMLEMTIYDLDSQMTADRWAEQWQARDASQRMTLETIHRTKDGRLLDMEVNVNRIERQGQVIQCVFARDISERKRAQREMVRLRKAVEASGEAMFMTDPDGMFTFVNSEFTHIYGYAADEVVGIQTPRILKSGQMTREEYADFWKRIESGEIVKCSMMNRAKDGQLVMIDATVNPVFTDNGEIMGYLAIHRNVMDRVREENALRESESNLRWLVDNLNEGITIVDLNEYFTYANPAAGQVFGIPREKLIGRCLSEFMTHEEFEKVRGYTRARQQGVSNQYVNEIQTAGGQSKRLLVTATPQYSRDGTVHHVLAVCRELDPDSPH